ncbi:hypothetical protein [Actinokineospora sp.]|uniref:hypothetical protein n=1 Tax=Actinokineospora sp. TaxID=1872133 RepID=UPI00403761B6
MFDDRPIPVDDRPIPVDDRCPPLDGRPIPFDGSLVVSRNRRSARVRDPFPSHLRATALSNRRPDLTRDTATNLATAREAQARARSHPRADKRVPDASGESRLLPVRADLAALLPWGGLRRGGTVAVRDSASLLLTLLAEPTARGWWGAVVGLPDLGVLAAGELGVAVDRLALVPSPGGDLPGVVAALLDGFDMVAVAIPKITDAHARRLSARARSRGSVLLPFGAWPGADLELRCTRGRWSGLGSGHGHLRARQVDVHARGRGAAARPVRVSLTLQGSPSPPPPPAHDRSAVG